MSNTTTTTDIATPLPADFTPGSKDVVIGKGKKFYFHEGNQWLRAVVAERIDQYSKAVTKAEKSNTISSVVDLVKNTGRFVKLDLSGEWVYAEPLLCREKVSQTFRDNLAETYKSSNVAKRNKRRQEQEEKTNLAIANMVLYPPRPTKRIRTNSYDYYNMAASMIPTKLNTPLPSNNNINDFEPLPVAPASPSSCTNASWFDWDSMPMHLLNEEQQQQRSHPGQQRSHPGQQLKRQSAVFSLHDFDNLFMNLANENNDVVEDSDLLEPLPAFSSLDMMTPNKSLSSSSEEGSNKKAPIEVKFQGRTIAAFAA